MTATNGSRLTYQDQSAHDLKLKLINGPVDIAQFTVLEQASLNDGQVTIQASIIGASHCLQVSADGQTFTEVLACCPVESRAPTYSVDPWQRRDGACVASGLGPVADYVNHLTLTECQPHHRAPWREGHAAVASDTYFRLAYWFPANGRPGAVTKIEAIWYRQDRLLHVKTLHSYPNEGKTALTDARMIIVV